MGDLEDNHSIRLELNPQILVLPISLKLGAFPSHANLAWPLR